MGSDSEQSPGAVFDYRLLPSARLHVLAAETRRYAELLYRRDFDLKMVECRILNFVNSAGTVSFKRLCQKIGVDKSYTSRLTLGLINRGLIEKIADPADQRSFLVGVTPAGRKMSRAALAAANERNARWLSVLTAEQQKDFFRSVELLITQARELADKEDATGGSVDIAPAEDAEDAPAMPAPPAAAGATVPIDARWAQELYDHLGAALALHDKSGGR